MPEKTGPELCAEIRKTSWGRYLYFILFTAEDAERSLLEGIEAGANAFLKKPVFAAELRASMLAGLHVIDLDEKRLASQAKLAEKHQELRGRYRKISEELELASKLHIDMLPLPKLDGITQFDWLYSPCDLMGGDSFGYGALDNDHYYFYQIDVAGHGVASALMAFSINKSITNLIDRWLAKNITQNEGPYDPAFIANRLNDTYQCSGDTLFYFTMTYGVFNQTTGTMRYIQAGHPHIVQFEHETNKMITHEQSGFPIGIVKTPNYQIHEIQLKSGDRAYICTDGVIECENAAREFLGEARLQDLLLNLPHTFSKDNLHALSQGINAWRDGADQSDDITLLTLAYEMPEAINKGAK